MGIYLKLIPVIMLHPIDAFSVIKRDRDKYKWWPFGLLLLAMAVLMRFLSIYLVHFPVSGISSTEANIVLEVGIILLPVLTWVIASYAFTSIVGGETKLNEI